MTSSKRLSTPLALLLMALQFFFLTTGCGYTNPQTRIADFDRDGDGRLTIFLDMWDNQTNLLGFQGQIEQSLIRKLSQSNRFSLTQNRARADYVLAGTIYAVDIPGISYGLYDRASQVRAEVQLGYRLVDAGNGKAALNRKKYTKRESFKIAANAITTQSNQDLALNALADNLADDIDIQLFYLFTRDRSSGSDIIPSEDIEQLE